MNDGSISVSAEVFAELGRAVKLMTHNAEEINRLNFERRQRQKNRSPISHSPRGSVIIPNTNVGFVDLGGPERGRRWVVRRLAFCDSLGLSTAAPNTSVDLFVTPGVATAEPENFYFRLTGSPGSIVFTSEALVVLPHNRLIARVEGADVVTGHQYVVGCTVEDMDEAGKAGNEWIL